MIKVMELVHKFSLKTIKSPCLLLDKLVYLSTANAEGMAKRIELNQIVILLYFCAICLSSSCSMLCNVVKSKLCSRYHKAEATNF